MTRRAAFVALALAITLTTTLPVHARAAANDPVRESVGETIRKLDLQTNLPRAAADNVSGWDWDYKLPSATIWVVAALFAVILLCILRDLIPGWRSRDDDGWADGGLGGIAGPASAQVSLTDADLLAGQGRFVEAMHLLLLHSLAEIRRRLKLEFSDSLTSREIVRRARLPEEGTAALRGIVTRVELSYFGDHPAARPDYDVCRVRYQELSEILARSAA
jgi:hypothetical protein